MQRISTSFIAGAGMLMLVARAPDVAAREPRLLEAPPFQAAPRPTPQAQNGTSPKRDEGYASPASFQAPVNKPTQDQPTSTAIAPSDQRSATQPASMVNVPQSPPAQAPFLQRIASQDTQDQVTRNTPAPSAYAKSPASAAATGPLSISQSARPKPLAPTEKRASPASANSSQTIDALLTVVGSLGIVVGLFLVTVWSLRRSMPKHARTLPDPVVEVLGRARLSGRQQMHLIRFGSKLVLAAVSPSGVDAISEITDSEEVDRLAGHCQAGNPFSASNAFRGLLAQLDEQESHEPSRGGSRRERGLASFLGLKGRAREDEYA